ncbi:hypothetical protein GCM10009122_23380 [Fulvivirga kasyanovii]|uniref:DUF4760 domain-containing protein n=1 Tax=Fulvivirga kasyanovii TaxID=396812 RepID=A0ABW9RYF4_9BACT|nr:hypothetical protein [Fulvivirga kasyanovii]MTI28956.1 hypothetical protein [Fulvivirga kasyanovii]
MSVEITALLSSLIAATVALVVSRVNNKNQYARDLFKYETDNALEKKRDELGRAREYYFDQLNSLEQVNQILHRIIASADLTTSTIQSTKNLSVEEFDQQYLSQRDDLSKLAGIVIAKFPDMYSAVSKIDGLHNQYWGSQRELLQLDFQKDKERGTWRIENIVNVEREIFEESQKIINKSLEISENIKSTVPDLWSFID